MTNVSQRFQKKEILESILFPSQIISDQFATHSLLLTDGRVISGMTSPVGDGALILLDSTGQKMTVSRDDIETTTRSRVSAMPEGLLNKLSIEEVSDLFAYLSKLPQSDVAKRSEAKKR